jgi:hypothetical protein
MEKQIGRRRSFNWMQMCNHKETSEMGIERTHHHFSCRRWSLAVYRSSRLITHPDLWSHVLPLPIFRLDPLRFFGPFFRWLMVSSFQPHRKHQLLPAFTDQTTHFRSSSLRYRAQEGNSRRVKSWATKLSLVMLIYTGYWELKAQIILEQGPIVV